MEFQKNAVVNETSSSTHLSCEQLSYRNGMFLFFLDKLKDNDNECVERFLDVKYGKFEIKGTDKSKKEICSYYTKVCKRFVRAEMARVSSDEQKMDYCLFSNQQIRELRISYDKKLKEIMTACFENLPVEKSQNVASFSFDDMKKSVSAVWNKYKSCDDSFNSMVSSLDENDKKVLGTDSYRKVKRFADIEEYSATLAHSIKKR